MSNKSISFPILMFPLRIETRFVDDKLLIRVFPDEALQQSHNPYLTEEEWNDAKAFKPLKIDEEEQAWENLVSKYGVYRSTWLVQITEEELANQKNDKEASIKANDHTTCFKGIPDKFVFYFYPHRNVSQSEKATPIVKWPKKGRLSNGLNDDLLVFDESDDDKNWITDFAEAEKSGMALKLTTEQLKGHTSFERIVVTGFYNEQINPKATSDEKLVELFKNHQYTEGLDFLKYGTATNSFGDYTSGFSIADEYDAIGSYQSIAKNNTRDQSDGFKLAQALGLDDNVFISIKNSDLTSSSKTHYLIQKLSWFALGGETLANIFGDLIDSPTHETIWKYYSEYVKARGPFPSIKIGDQPYGILPVTHYSSVTNSDTAKNNSSESHTTERALSLLFSKWKELVKTDNEGGCIPRLGYSKDKDIYTELYEVLSMQEASSGIKFKVKKYDRLRHQIPSWLEKEADIPTALGYLPIAQVYCILEEHDPEFESYNDFDSIKEKAKKIIEIFDAFMGNKKRDYSQKKCKGFNENILFSYKLSFKDIFDDDNKETLLELENLAHPVPLYPKDIKPLEDFFKIIEEDARNIKSNPPPDRPFDNKEKDIPPNTKLPVKTSFIYYKGETTVLTDFLLRAYSNLMELYNRTVSFSPSIDSLVGYESFVVVGISELNTSVSTSETVVTIEARSKDTSKNKTIEIKAPFSGVIKEIFVTKDKDEVINSGKMLFRVESPVFSGILRDFFNLGLALVNELKNNKDQTEIENAIYETIDLNSYRLDAWLTGIAAKRLEELRNDNRMGIHLGAYGWVEDLYKDVEEQVTNELSDKNTKHSGGIIHCPSTAQSLASTIFKSSYLSQEDNTDSSSKSNPFTLNLTSERVQQSKKLMQGMREDQEIEALLGYRLERLLHDKGQDAVIYTLREKFPLEENITNRAESNEDVGFKQLRVINGLSVIRACQSDNLHQHLQILSDPDIDDVIDSVSKVLDTLDGTADHLFYEAGYQLIQGNLTQSSAAMDAAKGAIQPPETNSLKTKIPGVGITHKLVYLFPQITSNYQPKDGKAFIEPVLEGWLMQMLGPQDKIGCEVQIKREDKASASSVELVEVKLSELNISYQDFLYLSVDEVSDGASELELRIWKVARPKEDKREGSITYTITETAAKNCQSLAQALEVARYAFQLLSKSRFVKTDDLATLGERVNPNFTSASSSAWNALKEERERFNRYLTMLQDWARNPIDNLEALASLNISEAKHLFLSDLKATEMGDIEKLQNEINKLIHKVGSHINRFNSNIEKQDYYSIFNELQEAAKSLFGKAFILLPPAFASANVQSVINANKQQLLVGDPSINTTGKVWGQERIQSWIQELAQVKTNIEVFEEWQMISSTWQESLNKTAESSFQIVQYPTLNTYPWVGLDKDEIDTLGNHKIYAQIKKFEPKEKQIYPQNSESLMIYSDNTVTLTRGKKAVAQYGIVIEDFHEHIPHEKLNTGLSFQYDGPNNEAPQSLLLAVPDPDSEEQEWSEDMLRDIIIDTMDLMKIRMIDAELLKEYDFLLPMTHLINIPRLN